jgi:hypothetical protein
MRMNMFAVYDKAKQDTENVKRLILGGDQAYDHSSDKAAVVA